MADNDLEARARGYVDAFNAQKGIRWKDISGHFARGGDADSLAKWISDKYNIPFDEARKYSMANAVLFDQRTDVGGRRLSQNENVAKMLGDLTPPTDPNAPQGPTGPDPRKQYLDWITQFTQAMGRPAGPGDPIFDSLTKMGAARASMNVGAQGVRVGRGGLGEAAIQQGANAAVMPYQMQRKQLEAQGLGMLDQAKRGWEGLDQNAHLLNQNAIQMNNQNMAQAWAQSQNQNQATGATAGGLLGLLGGGIATIATGGAAAPLIPGLMTGGSQIGAGIAGNSGPSYRPQQYRPYTPNSSGY